MDVKRFRLIFVLSILVISVLVLSSSVMAAPTVCGDGYLNTYSGEQCDDGNLVNGDGCSSQCLIEGFCGNGVKEGSEQCDDGKHCSDRETRCVSESMCVKFKDSSCVPRDQDGCSSRCMTDFVCGNGIKEGLEQCDDGNINSGDGCSSLCVSEAICPVGSNCCEGDARPTNLNSNRLHCGVCDNECDVGKVCVNGGCTVPVDPVDEILNEMKTALRDFANNMMKRLQTVSSAAWQLKDLQ